MPLPVTFGSATARGFGFTLASGGGKFGWLAKLTYTGPNSVNALYPIILNKTSSGSYVANLLYLNTGNNEFQYIVSFNDLGTAITSTSSYGDNSLRLYYEVQDSILDSSNNIINVGRVKTINNCCVTRYFPYAAITNASSTNIASRQIGQDNFGPYAVRYVSLYSDNSLLIAGELNNGFIALYKMTSTLSSSITWTRRINTRNNFAASLNSSGVAIVLINYSEGTLAFVRIDSSGSVIFNGSGYNTYINGFNGYSGGTIAPSKPVFDSSDNFYFTGSNGSLVYVCCSPIITYKVFLASMNSAGSASNFAVQFTAGGNFTSPTRVSRDGTNNYFATVYSGSQGSGIAIFKVNNSGSVQWARLLTGSSISINRNSSLVINGTDYLIPFIVNPTGSYVLKMPIDGSGIGTTFSLGGNTFTYSTLTDFTVSNLTITFQNNITTEVNSESYGSSALTNTLAASTDISITNKKV
jgi:hypothetical protein